MRWLWRRGIAPEQVLIVGDELGPLGGLPGSDSLLLVDDRKRTTAVSVGVEPGGPPDGVVWLGGGPEAFAAVLEDQIARRRRGELPIVVEDPAWVLAIDDADPLLERVHESLLTLADGHLGTRGSSVSRQIGREPDVLMSGVYARAGAETHLLAAPRWSDVVRERRTERCAPTDARPPRRGAPPADRSESRLLDALLFSSLARPGTPALRARGRLDRTRLARALEPPPAVGCEEGEDDGLVWMRVTGPPASIAAAAASTCSGHGSERVLDRIAAYEGVSQGAADHHSALDRVRRARRTGFDGLLAEHRRAWASRWEDADVVIDGDPELQLAVRFALFHLMASVAGRR